MMLITHLQIMLTTPITEISNKTTAKFSIFFWFSLSLCFPISYAIVALKKAFSAEYVVGDNAREYLSWMYRYIQPELFPNDLIADYFQSITPIGYGFLYQSLANLGIDPVLLSKIFPLVLVPFTTGYCFFVCLELFPVPLAGFIATLLLNQSIGIADDFVSACPRDFFYALFLAFVYYLLRGSLLPTLIAIALQSLFYPLIAFISSAILILRLCRWQKIQFFSTVSKDYLFGFTGVGIAILTLIPYSIQSSEFGPTITDAIARTLPDYLAGGRVSYYNLNPLNFWLDGRDSGILALMSPLQLFIGLLLPILLLNQHRFPLSKHLNHQIKILPQIVLASVTMFFIAHAIAFKLHFPSRYTHHTIKIVLAIAAGMVITIILNAAFNWAINSQLRGAKILVLGIATCVGLGLVSYPSFLKTFPRTPYIVGKVPGLYKFLQQQPINSVIASLTSETDNIPVFSQRSILAGKEYALPFHLKYDRQFRQRMLDLINAQYSRDRQEITDFIHKYRISFWLLDRQAFTPNYITSNNWIRQYQPAATNALTQLNQSQLPILVQQMKSCNIFEAENLILLATKCIEKN